MLSTRTLTFGAARVFVVNMERVHASYLQAIRLAASQWEACVFTQFDIFPPSPSSSSSPLATLTGGGAILKGYMTEMHAGILPQEYTAASCIIAAGTPIHERQALDVHTGHTVGNDEVPGEELKQDHR